MCSRIWVSDFVYNVNWILNREETRSMMKLCSSSTVRITAWWTWCVVSPSTTTVWQTTSSTWAPWWASRRSHYTSRSSQNFGSISTKLRSVSCSLLLVVVHRTCNPNRRCSRKSHISPNLSVCCLGWVWLSSDEFNYSCLKKCILFVVFG